MIRISMLNINFHFPPTEIHHRSSGSRQDALSWCRNWRLRRRHQSPLSFLTSSPPVFQALNIERKKKLLKKPREVFPWWKNNFPIQWKGIKKECLSSEVLNWFTFFFLVSLCLRQKVYFYTFKIFIMKQKQKVAFFFSSNNKTKYEETRLIQNTQENMNKLILRKPKQKTSHTQIIGKTRSSVTSARIGSLRPDDISNGRKFIEDYNSSPTPEPF